MKKISVISHANIALIKYWGKRDTKLFLPTKSSLSVTLDSLKTFTTISFNNKKDEVFFEKKANPKLSKKVLNFLLFFRKTFGIKNFFNIKTKNSFPTSAGLASSASGFSALALGLSQICNLNLTKKEISILARQASGSACRSLFGGFVLWNKGNKLDGSDSFAQQVFNKNFWPEFRVLVLVVSEKEKKIGSREAMQITTKTSYYYKKWIKESEENIPKIIDAINKKDIKTVGQITQNDCICMHKSMQNSNPCINYWTKETIEIINKIKNLQESKVDCFFTIDAGPNIKLICLEKDLEKLKSHFKHISGIKTIIECKIGEGIYSANY